MRRASAARRVCRPTPSSRCEVDLAEVHARCEVAAQDALAAAPPRRRPPRTRGIRHHPRWRPPCSRHHPRPGRRRPQQPRPARAPDLRRADARAAAGVARPDDRRPPRCPTIVGDLGGIEHLSWVVTAYLLASTVSTPIYGKLGDLYGRKLVLQVAIVLFLVGSVLCGAGAGHGPADRVPRVQGLGGGGLMVTTIAVVGDIIPPRDRGRYQGFFGAVFGVSTVIGPLLGGFFVEHLSWRWIFYVNLPVGAAALAVIAVAFHAPPTRVQPRRSTTSARRCWPAALSALVLFTSLGGTTYAWDSPDHPRARWRSPSCCTAPSSCVERRAAEPILPLRAVPQPRLRRHQRRRLHRRPGAVRRRHVPAALPAGRQGPQPDRLGAAARRR